MTPYLQFDRSQWAALRDSVPMTLTEDEIAQLKGINEDLSLEEVAEIYLPLSPFAKFLYQFKSASSGCPGNSFWALTASESLTSSVSRAASQWGKSTTARVLQALLSRWPEHRRVELITTDGFLHPKTRC
ncbi:pantothenate kinase [Salmonella enterica subsp. enterica]|nr:pantothenate kinase [Salmonella enterica subsp. enterica]